MRNSRPWAMAPSLAAVVLLALTGVGQGQLGIGGPGEGTKLALLRLPAVRKELELTPKQDAEIARLGEATKTAKKGIDAASKALDKAREEAIPKGNPDTAKEAKDAALADLESSADASLRKILDAGQRARLAELALQAEGPQAFLKPYLIQALDLSEDQVEQIQGILGAVRERQDQAKAIQKRSAELGTLALEKVTKDRQKAQLRGFALKVGRRAMAEIGKVLSKKQKDKYSKLLGEPIDLGGLTDAEGRKLFGDSADLGPPLLEMPAIREELKLTAEQVARLDRGEPAARILEPAQRARLAQVALQGEGPSAFTRPEVIRSLKLDEEQVDRIAAILDGLGDDRRQLREARKQADEARKAAGEADPAPDVEKARKEAEKAEHQAEGDRMGVGVMARIAASLTKGQRDAFRKQLGEPFDFAKLQGAGGRPAPGVSRPPGG